MSEAIALTEGYTYDYYPVRYKFYSPKAKMKVTGRWQRMNEYGGWENLGFAPSPVTSETVTEQLAAKDARIAELEAQIKALTTPSSGVIEAYSGVFSDTPLHDMPSYLAGIAAVERHARIKMINDVIEQMTIWHEMGSSPPELMSLLRMKEATEARLGAVKIGVG